MPTYEYTCSGCGKKFEKTMPLAEQGRAKTKCPKCGSGRIAQRFSGFFSKTSRKS